RHSDIATDLLACVTDALALVRIVLTKTTDVRSDLSDDLLVDTGDGQLRGAIGSEGNSLRSLHEDRVRVTQSELQVLTLLRCTVADAKDFHLDGEPLGDSNDGVVDARARQAVQCTVLTVVSSTDNANFVVLNFLGDWSWDLNVKGAFWALN